jgi:hypothetical protein
MARSGAPRCMANPLISLRQGVYGECAIVLSQVLDFKGNPCVRQCLLSYYVRERRGACWGAPTPLLPGAL